MQKRSRMTITMEILEVTLTPKKKMKIMYKVNLNYLRFNKYLSELLTKGFVEAVKDSEGNRCYLTSQRGRELLAVLKKANDLGFCDEEYPVLVNR
jgi:predicted transcriptional regulator